MIATVAKSDKYLIVIFWLAFFLRIQELASIPVYLDEYLTITSYVSLAIPEIFKNYYSNNHPLASLLAHLYSPNADNYFLMRWPMVCIGVVTLPLLYRLGASLVNRKVALITVLLLTVSPYHLAFSTSVRGYGGLVLGVMISLYLLVKALSTDNWRYWLGFGVVNLITLYFHLFSLLATMTQFIIIGGWFIWQLSRQSNKFGKLVIKPATLMLAFAVIGLLLFNLQIHSVLSENGGVEYANNDFGGWRDGFNSLADIDPLITFVSLSGPMSPFGFETYVYVVLAVIGWASLFFKDRAYSLAITIWFVTPFITIFIATQIFGPTFYAYVRFLLYLLPLYLLLVALGITTLLDKSWVKNEKLSLIIKIILIAGLSALSLTSLYWYIIRATHADWQAVTRILAEHLHPQDIVVCQKYQNGFQGPESKVGQPYCMWMLDVPLPSLTAYTPHFEDTIEAIANYKAFEKNRSALNQPGGLWLVLWQKLSYSPHGKLTMADLPEFTLLPPLSDFAPYEVYRFGSITLVHVNIGPTLLDNIQQTLNLLLRIETQSADQARYYRSLAEVEALRGNKLQAKAFLELSWYKAEQAAQYPDLFLLDTKPVVERLPEPFVMSSKTIKMGYQITPSLCLHSYEVSPTTVSESQVLTLSLNWQTLDFIKEDYGYSLLFDDFSGKNLGHLEFQPFDRMFPTTWWWPKQKLAEVREITIPPDLPRKDYLIKLEAYDNQNHVKPFKDESNPLFTLSYQTQKNSWHIEPTGSFKSECP